MALNLENLGKYKKAAGKKVFTSSSASDRYSPRGELKDVLMVVLPPVGYENGKIETFPLQHEGVFAHFRNVHNKVGKGGQQKSECLKTFGEECELCLDARVTSRFTPYIILVREVEKDGVKKYFPVSKPLVADFPGSVGDSIVADLSDSDKVGFDDLENLPVYKYSKTGKGIDTEHTIGQRPANHRFNLNTCLFLDEVKDGDNTEYQCVKSPNNPAFADIAALYEYIALEPWNRLYKPSPLRVKAARLGLDLQQKDDVLKLMVNNSGGNTSVPKTVSIEEADRYVAGDTSEINDDDIPF